MGLSQTYPWNVRLDVAGVTFEGPGMEDRNSAEAIADMIAEEVDDTQKVEVFRQ